LLLRSQPYSQAEDRATSFTAGSAGTKLRCSVEIPIRAFEQRRVGQYTVHAVKGVQRGQSAAWGNFKDGAGVADSEPAGCPIEIPVCSLDQRIAGSSPVPAAEAVQRGQRAPEVMLKTVPEPPSVKICPPEAA
jgi:hypothetical protein